MTKYENRLSLYINYCGELDKYAKGLVIDEDMIKTAVSLYLNEDKFIWKDIIKNDEMVGFLIYARDLYQIHDESALYICEAYIVPEYRRQGYLTSVLKEIVTDNVVYIEVYRKNYSGFYFWNQFFEKMDYVLYPGKILDKNEFDLYEYRYVKRDMNREISIKSYDEMNAIISDLDMFSRIICGQYDMLFRDIFGIWFYDERKYPELTKQLMRLRNFLIPELKFYSFGSSLGIWSEDTPLIAQRAYDIQQCLRFIMAWHRNPQGDITVDFRKPFLHGEWNVGKDRVKEYQKIVDKYYPSCFWYKDKWDCPVIFDDFSDDDETVKMICDDNLVLAIIDMAYRWKMYLKDMNFVDLFHEVLLCTGSDKIVENIAEIDDVVEDIQTKVISYKRENER